MPEQEMMPSVVEFDSDISQAEKPRPLPEGEYVATIVDANVALSQKGTKYAVVQFLITPDQYPADYVDGGVDGTRLFYRRLSLENTPQAKWRLKQFYAALKLPAPGTSVDMATFKGCEAKIVVKHEVFMGEPQASVDQIRAV